MVRKDISIAVAEIKVGGIEKSLEYLKVAYELHRAPCSPEWDEVKPRVEKYLDHLFKST